MVGLFEVAGDVDILPPIVVVIEPVACEVGVPAIDAYVLAVLLESSVAEVLKQDIFFAGL